MRRILQHDIFLSFYGDDFTGSTDVMESLHLQGIPAALFLAPPTPEEVETFRLKTSDEQIQAFGVAGVSRTLSPEQMDVELPPIFEEISRIPSDFFHYKICSTFDSAPHVGNIGHATQIALRYFPSPFVPLIVGAPSLNRFCVFGHLFARVDDTTYRLDRHPTMSKHPVTPMDESDLAIHLAKQTDRPVRQLDVFALEAADPGQYFDQLETRNGEYILFDTFNTRHLLQTGRLIVEKSQVHQLLVGSSGTEYALTSYLQQTDKLEALKELPEVTQVSQMIALAGSASPMTQQQIEHVLRLGFEDIRIDTRALVDPNECGTEYQRILDQSRSALQAGKSLMIYSARGPEDPAISRTLDHMQTLGITESTSVLLAGTQGAILKTLLEEFAIKRVVVAGGDTSGQVARALGIYALETLIPIAPGAPLCLAHSRHPRFDGLEISLKGGQNGNSRYFESILTGNKL